MYKSKVLYIILIYLTCLFSISICAIKCDTKCCHNDPAVKNFQEYLKINTSGGNNLGEVIQFLEHQAAELGLPVSVYYPDGKPICVISWIGANSSLPSIMLNSHADVVPVEEKFWTYLPFSGHIDENCNIHGRGTQDTKGVTIQYLEAIRKLKQNNVTLQRTLHVTVMPDEETGGFLGIKPFSKTKEFNDLNVGFVLDEGVTSGDDVYIVSYQDRRAWQMKFTVFGQGGHGSGMPHSSAMEKIYKLFSIIIKFREEQDEIKKQKDSLDHGHYSSININIISGGLAANIIPSELSLVADMRLAIDADVDAVQAMVESWRSEVGNDTVLEFIRRDETSPATQLQRNPYWQAMLQAAKDIGITLKPIIIAATSDMVVLRNMGIPALGFAPRVRTKPLLHANNEYLNVEIFKEGIGVYVAMLKRLGNVLDATGITETIN